MPSNNDDQKKQAVVAFAAGAIMGAATTVLFIHGAPPGTVRPVTNLKRYVRSPDFVPHFMFATFFWVGV
ncbi:hypothetical protein DL546_007712 [Coniochaeta pulveracea]|uniref:Uncharacterized protein n=1 Tax=Coniochaeta pulveracea TaxID=177199 RepID=A0A420YC20_9PEZI|nr:hypothetical protein DL546_007712 [Coniochaeta pulveracea]